MKISLLIHLFPSLVLILSSKQFLVLHQSLAPLAVCSTDLAGLSFFSSHTLYFCIFILCLVLAQRLPCPCPGVISPFHFHPTSNFVSIFLSTTNSSHSSVSHWLVHILSAKWLFVRHPLVTFLCCAGQGRKTLVSPSTNKPVLQHSRHPHGRLSNSWARRPKVARILFIFIVAWVMDRVILFPLSV